MDAVSYKGRKFRSGGKLEELGASNVVPDGALHKENNNLGNKDKGIPIIAEDGQKLFEVEREELILRLDATEASEKLADKYRETNDDNVLIELGKLLADEIMSNTHDLTGKYSEK